ncbi:hypothetical protein FACS1894110_18480 [Spirochaetia bacterium]|nr:hypothetical protein FACS1894110_18480 [Spirochaetia bacterium]
MTRQQEWALEMIERFPDKPPMKLISEYVENRRVLPPSSPFPGAWRNQFTPYSVEIMDNCSPFNPCQRQTILKSRKLGLSTAIENCIAYFMGEVPSVQAYSTASGDLAKEMSTSKLGYVLDSMGLRNLLAPLENQNAKSRSTGDKLLEKIYPGGKLLILTSASMMARRALDLRCLFVDELDGLDPLTSSDEGEWLKIMMAHTDSYGPRKKITLFGSPGAEERSVIKPYYESGDQRKFLVPCPNCGRHIELKDEYLKPETKGGELIDAYLECPHCHGEISNNDKLIMYSPEPHCQKYPKKKLEPARWEPTKKPDPIQPSYHINSLYSPKGMFSFKQYYIEKQEAEAGGPDAMRSFVNTRQGLPFKESGEKPKIKDFAVLRGNYREWTVPDDVIYLTMGCDVQRGERKIGTNNPARIEATVMGTGIGGRHWVIGHREFLGETTDAFDGAFENFWQWCEKNQLKFYRSDGTWLQVQVLLMDGGDVVDGRDAEVVKFCARFYPMMAFPLKGFGMLRADAKKGEKPDLPNGMQKFRWRRTGPADENFLQVSTWHYKMQLYNSIKLPRQAAEPQKYGFNDFPMETTDEYFRQLLSAERLSDGSFKDAIQGEGRRVEALDCFVYSMAASDVWLDHKLEETIAYYKKAGSSPEQLEVINKTFVLKRLRRELLGIDLAEEAAKDV